MFLACKSISPCLNEDCFLILNVTILLTAYPILSCYVCISHLQVMNETPMVLQTPDDAKKSVDFSKLPPSVGEIDLSVGHKSVQ